MSSTSCCRRKDKSRAWPPWVQFAVEYSPPLPLSIRLLPICCLRARIAVGFGLIAESPEQLVELESRWLRIMEDIASNKKKLIVLKNESRAKESNVQKKGLFKRMLEIVTSSKVKGQEELERMIRGSQLIQEETYMRTHSTPYLGLLEYHLKMEEYQISVTFKGKFYNFFGKVAAVVCIIKIFIVFFGFNLEFESAYSGTHSEQCRSSKTHSFNIDEAVSWVATGELYVGVGAIHLLHHLCDLPHY
eukprot:TRINITY_DN9344_c0_g1_i2.p1 TRINITY_DN9344_c0_g1~~TRINITY_DN9344_c0_g1_i2.p1  ORF type:complete len:246 (+),score=20.34 TRINITY_DN9344_c0_g1_i2:423-1160(+)